MRENKKTSKEALIEILDGLYLQIIWICLCIDELEALEEVGNEKIKIAKNFIYITHSSLIYRFSMELAKLFDETQNALSIHRISNLCSENEAYFHDGGIVQFCRDFKKSLKSYNEVILSVCNRRDKTYAHNDIEYYLFNEKAIKDFPIDFEKIKKMANLLYNFAYTMCEKIGSKRLHLSYPANTDDVKRLFGMKTEDDIWLENANEDFS